MVLPFMGIKDIISPNSGFARNIILRNLTLTLLLNVFQLYILDQLKKHINHTTP